jgi:DNA-binding Xre family transcriptional regulator
MVVENRVIDLIADKMKREQRLISVTEVARECGMSRQNAIKWLNNKIKCYPAETLAAFCQYFNCTPGDLLVLTYPTQELH